MSLPVGVSYLIRGPALVLASASRIVLGETLAHSPPLGVDPCGMCSGLRNTQLSLASPQPSGCDPELTGLAGTPSLCSLQSLTAKGIGESFGLAAVLASELSCVARLSARSCVRR